MKPFIAQAASTANLTNAPAAAIALKPSATLVERVSEATGLPPTVVLWASVIVEALIVVVSRWGYLEPGRPVPEGSLLEAWRTNVATLVKQHEWVLPGGAAGESRSRDS